MEEALGSAYQHLALADVRPGMVLSDVLLDRQGQVLLPQGAVLTESIIALLPRHGVEALAVLRHADTAAAAPDYAMLEQRLAYLFRRNNIMNHDVNSHTDAASTTLHRYMAHYRLGRESAQ